jgi:hypothetical protein
LVSLFLGLAGPLLLSQLILIKPKSTAELSVGARQHLGHVEVLLALIHEQLTARPNHCSVVEVQEQREGLLFGDVAVQVSLDVVDLGFHRGVGSQEKVGVTAEQVAHVRRRPVRAVTHDKPVLFLDQVASVLKNEFGVKV